MSRPPILIKELVKGNQVWKMHIRVVDLWVVKEKSGQEHIELVIQDPKGDQIHVTTRNREYKNWLQQLKEHQTYCIYNGEPVMNDGAFKVCANELKLIFNGGTTISSLPIPEIPHHQYNFKPIHHFLCGNFKTDLLYDVIGVLQDVVKTQMGGGGKKSCANITVCDEGGNVIEVALWDDYAKQFTNYNMFSKVNGPTIVVLTHAWCKTNTASGLPSLSNAWNGSKLHINFDHPQVNNFKDKIVSKDFSKAVSHSLTQTSESFVPPANKSWTNLSELKTIRQISEMGKDCFATTIGTTKRFKASKFGWYFETCPSCKKSNKSSVGNKFECDCRETDVEPITKYKIEVEVEFDNHVGCFVFWDKDCIPFIEMSATELRKLMKDAGEDNPKIYPTHLDKILNKKLAFRVKYTPYYQQFSIVSILKDNGLYSTFYDHLNPNEHTSHATDLEIGTAAPPPVQCQQMLTRSIEDVATSQPAASAVQSWSPSTSSSTTPAKRVAISTSLDEILQDEGLTPMQSATKVKHIKKE